MVKALSVCAIAALLAAALTFLPGFTPDVKASAPRTSSAAAKSDRLTVRIPCAQQSWPNVDASCLRRDGSAATVRPVRVVTAGRT